MRAKLTLRLFDKFKDGAPFIVWDTERKGLCLRRQTQGGRATYAFRYVKDGKKREIKIGCASVTSIDAARLAAEGLGGDVARKADPAGDRDKAKAEKTLAQVWAAFAKFVLPKKRGETPAGYARIWKKHLEPRLGSKKLSEIGFDEAEEMHAAVTAMGGKRDERGHRHGGPYAANRALALLSILYGYAAQKRWVAKGYNPVDGVERNPEYERDLQFSDEELALIVRALEPETLDVQIAFGLFMEVPARHDNVAAAEWGEFPDLTGEAPMWRIPAEKLKGGRPYEAFISRALADNILKHQKATIAESPNYLFPRVERKLHGLGVKREIVKDKPRGTFQSAWERVRDRALALAGDRAASCRALKEGSPHVFKHTYLSAVADLGASAMEVQQFGDHASIQTSMRYVKGARQRLKDLAAQRQAQLPKPKAA